MGSQTAHGLPYPVGTDRVMDGDNAIQALAEAIEAALYATPGPLYDSGWLTLTPLTGWSAYSGYTPQIRRIGSRVATRGMFQNTSGANTQAIATAPADMRPTTTTMFTHCVSVTGKAVCQFAVAPSGAINIPSGYISGTASATDVYSVTGSWLIG